MSNRWKSPDTQSAAARPHKPAIPRRAASVPLRVAIFAVALAFMTASGAHAGTLAGVKENGVLRCGVSEGLAGFSAQDGEKAWRGFDVDFCRAMAAAIFGDGDKVEFVPLSAADRFEALKAGKVDVLSRNTTWTLGRDIDAELEFVGVSYYDGQGFLVGVDKGLSSALQLEDAKICILGGTTSVDNAKAYFARNKLKVEVVEFAKREEALEAYRKGDCAAYSADRSALASERTRLTSPDAHMLLPEVISKEPLGPAVRQDDPSWSELSRWVLFLLVNAEEAGWVADQAGTPPEEFADNAMKSAGIKLGLSESWASDVIRTVGNYGEIFDRNIGARSPLKLERGINALWTQGGILYAPPMR